MEAKYLGLRDSQDILIASFAKHILHLVYGLGDGFGRWYAVCDIGLIGY